MVLQRTVTRRRRAQQLQHLKHQGIEVDSLDRAVPFAGVGEHLRHKVRCALRAENDGADVAAHSARWWQLQRQQVGVADDARKQVVEIVGEAAGKHAKAFVLLLLLHARFERVALRLRPHLHRHVAQQDHPRCVPAALGAYRHRSHVVMDRLGIGRDDERGCRRR